MTQDDFQDEIARKSKVLFHQSEIASETGSKFCEAKFGGVAQW